MKSVGINTIRVHYPQSSDLLSLYDEYGFMMIEEVPLNWWGWFGGSQSLDILDQAKPALTKIIARDKNHPCVIIWSMGNECATDNETGITVMRELLKLAKSLDPTSLATFVVALNPVGHLAFDEVDIVCINKYNGIFSGKNCNHISEIDSLGYKPLIKELTVHRNTITKPIVITEYGTQGIKNIHGEVSYSEEFQATYIEQIWEGIRSVPGVSGGVLWCWADYYHRKYLITYAALSEEVKKPRRNILLATILVCLFIGAFIAFMGVNLSVFFHFFIREKNRKFINIVPPVIGFIFCFLIWINLRIQAQIAGSIWILIGMIVGFIKTKGFRKSISFSSTLDPETMT